ncbi:hypothetical protein BUY79_03180 [Staphylococcus equorum]|uniref:hypothetical protein n=1 Tax=Staphylococcus equorum TaxID=246432 RepID=UPI000D1C2945|nr:hypothetical protein [Staphylococcus equorum]PTE85084.1 hypothetical protein BUY79_03180 [Staphylococcus equorum]PTF09267.1 hypothetical protein BUY81_13110 [Staphylococcus equorum]
MSEYLNGLIESLELTEAQKLSKMNYDKEYNVKKEQEPKDPNDKLDSIQRQRKKENIMSIQDDTARQAEIAKNISLFK